jgi:hypothetical protein
MDHGTQGARNQGIKAQAPVPSAQSPVPSSYPRTLSTKELAAALSPPRKMRVVQKWADEGAPHTAAKGRGGKRLLWNLEEVQHWLEAQGRKADRTEKLFVLSAPATSGAAATPRALPGHHGGQHRRDLGPDEPAAE